MADAAPLRTDTSTLAVALRLRAHTRAVRAATGKRGKPDLDAYLAASDKGYRGRTARRRGAPDW